jgi:hypothetical protein
MLKGENKSDYGGFFSDDCHFTNKLAYSKNWDLESGTICMEDLLGETIWQMHQITFKQ